VRSFFTSRTNFFFVALFVVVILALLFLSTRHSLSHSRRVDHLGLRVNEYVERLRRCSTLARAMPGRIVRRAIAGRTRCRRHANA
jgi:hypothetical protein